MHLIIALAMMVLSGCGFAHGKHELFDTANLIPPVKLSSPQEVKIYRGGAFPEKGCYKVAMLSAHGNGYADRANLETALQEEAIETGSDSIVIVGTQVNNGMTVGTYGGGIGMGSTIQLPSMYGIACRVPPSTTGAYLSGKDKDFAVNYVVKGSPAEKAGVLEGDKWLTVNGRLLSGDPFVFEREINSKPAGSQIAVEFLRDGKKQAAVMEVMGQQPQWSWAH